MTKKHPNKNTSYISTASGHPIDADVVIINGVEYKRVEEPKPETNGVEYKRVEEPKPETLYDIIYEWKYNTYDPTCEELVNRIGNWLPKEHDTNSDGWNKCVRMLREKLR